MLIMNILLLFLLPVTLAISDPPLIPDIPEFECPNQINKSIPPYDVTNAELLMDKLFEGCGRKDQCGLYSKHHAPIKKGSAINLLLETYFVQIVKFDMETEVVSLMMSISLQWRDNRLTWDPCKKDEIDGKNETGAGYGISHLTVEPDLVWTPDLRLYNSADQSKSYLKQSSQVRLRIYPDGTVRWTPILIYDFFCSVRMFYFPFDIQLCNLKWGSWVYPKESLNLIMLQNQTDTHYMIENHIFHLVENLQILDEQVYTIQTNNKEEIFQDVKLFIMLKRNYKFYLINIVVPCALLCFLSFLSFWIPVCSGDRLGLSIHLVIAMSVYHLIVVDAAPSGQDNIPILHWFIFGMIILVYFSIIVTMINLKIEHSYQIEKPSEWVLKSLVTVVGFVHNLDECYFYKRWKYDQILKQNADNLRETILDRIKLTSKPKFGEVSQELYSPSKNHWITTCNQILNNKLFNNKLKRKSTISIEEFCQKTQKKEKYNYLRKSNLGKERELHFDERLADLEYKLYSWLLDKFCMVLYILSFIGTLVFLAIGWASHDWQVRMYNEEIRDMLGKN